MPRSFLRILVALDPGAPGEQFGRPMCTNEVLNVVLRTRISSTLQVLSLALAALWMPSVAEAAGDFGAWWPKLQAAVAAHDAKAVSQGARFPMNWENGPVRQIKTASDFTDRFNTYITPEIRKAIAKIKPERLPNGTYILTWKARGNEYSLYFAPAGDVYALDGLSEGPA
jgi:hypothetical protein